MFRVQHSWAIYLLVAIPLIVGLYLIYRYARRRALGELREKDSKRLMTYFLPRNKSWVKLVIFLLAWLFLIVGTANPQVGSEMEKVKREGMDVMIALDLSRSMNARDTEPSRLKRALRFIDKFIQELEGDRVGLIVFAGNAYLQMPLTTDYAAAKLYLESVSTDIIPTQGTAIGEAIRQGIDAFDETNSSSKVIVLISDGENHEGDAPDAAREAQKNGILLYTVGTGTTRGAPVPINAGSDFDFQRDKEGNMITSKLNPDMLRRIAVAGNGEYFPLQNSNETLRDLRERLATLDKTEMETRVFTDYNDYFQAFFAIALILLVLDSLISNRRNQFLDKLNLFGSRK